MEDEDGYRIDAGDGGGLVGRLNEQAKQQITVPTEELWQRYIEWEEGAPSEPVKYGGPPLSEQCAGLGYGGPYVEGYNEYIGYSEVKDCSEPGCFGDWRHTSWTGEKVCSKKPKWSGGRCAQIEKVNAEIASLRKSFYEGTLKPFYADVANAGGYTQYAYNPFPLANEKAEKALEEGAEVGWWQEPDTSGIKDSCQFIMQGIIKRLLETSYIAGYLAVAPMVIKDIADTYSFYAQRFIDTFKPYNPPPPPPPDDGVS